MDRITLPLVVGDATLAHVFDRMSESGEHAAIVVPPGRAPMLVTNRDVDEALENGLRRVSQLKGEPLHVSGSELHDWEGALDDAKKRYGVVTDDIDARADATNLSREVRAADDFDGSDGVGGMDVTIGRPRSFDELPARKRSITLVTRSERFAAELRGAGQVCRCRNNHRAPGGKPCRFCGSAVRCA